MSENFGELGFIPTKDEKGLLGRSVCESCPLQEFAGSSYYGWRVAIGAADGLAEGLASMSDVMASLGSDYDTLGYTKKEMKDLVLACKLAEGNGDCEFS